MSYIIGAAESACEALAGFAVAAAGIDDADNLNDLGRALALILEDTTYMCQRVADRVDDTGLAGYVKNWFHAAAAGARTNAFYASEQLDRGVIWKYR